MAAKTPTTTETVRVLREGQGSRPEVRLVRWGDQLLVLKDYSVGNHVLKALGLVLMGREQGAYERLAGIAGIPACPGRMGRYALAVEYVPGESANRVPVDLLTPEFFRRLESLVEAMHARGVVHGDLKRLDNILVSPLGEPALIDFSSACWHGSNPGAALVFPYIWDDDRRAICKLKARRVPHLLTPAEQAFLAQRPLVERAFRWSREYLRRPVQRLAGSEPENLTPRP